MGKALTFTLIDSQSHLRLEYQATGEKAPITRSLHASAGSLGPWVLSQTFLDRRETATSREGFFISISLPKKQSS